MFELFLSPENTFGKVLIAIGLGIFLGLRREIDFAEQTKKNPKKQKGRSSAFMGIRTMTLIAVLGVSSTFFQDMPYAPMLVFIPISVLVAISHTYGSFQLSRSGLTTELSALLMFWIGVLIGFNQYIIAIALTILLGSINAFKTQLRSLAGAITAKEWQSALQLLLLSGVILPFLPHEAIDPWGIFVPFNVWLLVILILSFEFVGYFLIKFYGAKGGIPLSGFLGSIVSSTAVTTSLATKSKESNHPRIFSGSILIALGTMQIRVMIEIMVFSPLIFWQQFILVPITMALISFLAGWFYVKTSHYDEDLKEQKNPDLTMDLGNPLNISPAVKFGGIFVLILAILGLARYYLGDSGVYVTAVLSGIVDIDAIVLSTLESFRLETLSTFTTQNAIFIALIVNTIIKIVYVFILGSRKVTKQITLATILSSVAGCIALASI